jgi:plastocyanin
MRSPILATLLGVCLAATGCTVSIDGGTGPTGDDNQPPGDDQPPPDPKLDVSMDKTTIMSELGQQTTVTVTLTGSGTFAGQVGVQASAVDTTGTVIPGWTVTVDQPSVTLTENGTATVKATMMVPTDAAMLSGKLQIAVSSSLPAITKTADVTVLNQVTLVLTSNAQGQCVYPTPAVTNIKVGTKVIFLNMSSDNTFVMRIHSNGQAGIAHEQVDTPVGQSYEQTASSAGSDGWYCHTPGNDPGNLRIVATN